MTRWKMHVYGLVVVVLVQILAYFLVNFLLKEFIGRDMISDIIRLIIVAICIVVTLYYLLVRVVLLRFALNKEAVPAKIEDIILIGYRKDHRTRYEPFPIVRSLHDSKLYFAYGNYSLLGFNTRFDYSDRDTISCTLYNSSGVPVRIGDTVDMYLLKTLKIPVSIDAVRNRVKLKHRKIKFRHVNQAIDIDVFKQTVFFRGVINVDIYED